MKGFFTDRANALRSLFRTHEGWLLVIILLVALAVRLWGIGFGLPHRYHIDEAPYVLAALKIARGDLAIDYPFNSPNLYQFLLTAEYGVMYVIGRGLAVFHSGNDVANLYRTDPTLFFLLARGTSAAFGVATVGVVYGLGKALRDSCTGLLAALFLGVAFFPVRDAHFAVTDTMLGFFVASCVLFSIRYFDTRRLRDVALAGVAGGIAFGLKYLPAPVLLVPAAALFVGKARLRDYCLLALVVLLGVLIAFPAPLISPSLFWLHLKQALGQASSALGNFQTDTVPAPVYYLRTLGWGLGWPLLVAAVVGLGLRVVRPGPKGWLIVLGIVGYYAGISLVHTYFARYALPLLPLLVVLAAEAVTAAMSWLEGRLPVSRGRLLSGLLILCLVVIPALDSFRFDYLLTQTDTRTQAEVWIEQNIPEGARLLVQWFGPPLSIVSDLEPGSQKAYDVVVIDPFETRREAYSLQHYVADHIQYVIITSFNTHLQLWDANENELRQQFYESLEREAARVVEFRPWSGAAEPAFVWEQLYGPANALFELDRPGPTVTIYKLDSVTP